MNRNSLSSVGGAFSILVGISYIVVGVTFLLMPVAQRPGASFDEFITSYAESSILLNIEYWAFALGALLALGVVPAIYKLVRSASEGWVRWASNLAYLGFSVTALGFLRFLTLYPLEAAAYADGNAATRSMIEGDNIHLPLDPNGWLQFGAIGIWVLVVSLAALRTEGLPKTWAYVGVAAAVLYWLVVAGNVLEIPILIAIAAGLGGIILAPIWYIWIGVVLRRSAIQPSAG
jgi:hypothetical protein